MFLFVSPNLLSVLSNFIPGAPFLENWVNNIEQDSTADAKENFDNMDHDSPSNVEHVTALMTGIILGRFGKSHKFLILLSSDGVMFSQIYPKENFSNLFIF